MTTTLFKHGDGLALMIDKPMLDLLNADAETPFDLMTDGRCIVLSPVRDATAEQKFQDALGMVHRRFGRAMKKLAE